MMPSPSHSGTRATHTHYGRWQWLWGATDWPADSSAPSWSSRPDQAAAECAAVVRWVCPWLPPVGSQRRVLPPGCLGAPAESNDARRGKTIISKTWPIEVNPRSHHQSNITDINLRTNTKTKMVIWKKIRQIYILSYSHIFYITCKMFTCK